MLQRLIVPAVGVLLMGALGCASTTFNSYSGGTVKSSSVKYNYTAQPILKDPKGKTYAVEANGFGSVGSVGAFEERGVRRASSGGDIAITIEPGAMRHEPGGFGMGDSYEPALISTVPIVFKVKDARGSMLLERTAVHEEILRTNSGAKFKTREEAKAAMAQITEMAKASAEKKVMQGASSTVSKNLDLIAKTLFEPREVAVTLPAIRSAGDVEMESAYALLSKAEKQEQVDQALQAYVALGTAHRKADGSDDTVGVYGVYCGMASARILSGDLPGAWQDTKAAWNIMPDGKEHREIAQVLHQQQQQAGVEIIPKEDYDEMVNKDMAKLKQMFGGQ